MGIDHAGRPEAEFLMGPLAEGDELFKVHRWIFWQNAVSESCGDSGFTEKSFDERSLPEWAGAGKARASGIFRGCSLSVAAECIQKIIPRPGNAVMRLRVVDLTLKNVFWKTLVFLNTFDQNQP
jgi:hypothetical protein